MKPVAIFSVLMLCNFFVFSQKEGEIYRVKNGADVTKTIPFNERYQFPDFRNGKVYFRNGRVILAKLNYSVVHSQIMFVGPTKDTLLLNDANFIEKITIDDALYYYLPDEGHIQQIAEHNDVKLGKRQFFLVSGSEKYSAYGQYSATSAISGYSSYINQDGNFQVLQGNDRVLLKKKSSYFWIDKNSRILSASKSNLLKIFPDHKKALSRYMRESSTDFDNENHLKTLLAYAVSL